MKQDTNWQRDRNENRAQLLGAGVFLKGAAIVFFLAGVVCVLGFESSGVLMGILLLVVFPTIILWALSVVARGIAHIEENTRPAPPTTWPNARQNRPSADEDEDSDRPGPDKE